MSFLEVVGSAVMLVGTLLSVLAAWGVVDFPSALARMHAATKSASLGLALIALGAGLASESAGLVGISVLMTVFLFMTAPISGHMLGRAVYSAGQAEGLVHDDLAGVSSQQRSAASGEPANLSLPRVVILTSVWVLLWRDPSPGVWAGGLAISFLVELVRGTRERRTQVQLWGLVRFLAYYVWMVVLSNLRVAWEVVTPNNDQIVEAIVAVPLQAKSTRAALLVANAVSYTPGSLAIELAAEPSVLYVHVLHFESVGAVREEVAELEARVVAAVGSERV